MDWSDSERMILSSFWSLKTCMDTMGFHKDLCRAEVFFLGVLQEKLICTRNKDKCRIEPVHAGDVDLDSVRGLLDGKPGIVI